MRGKRSPGTTATIALIRDGYELAVAQVGDSRAYLCRGGDARRLTTDHCPSEPGTIVKNDVTQKVTKSQIG